MHLFLHERWFTDEALFPVHFGDLGTYNRWDGQRTCCRNIRAEIKIRCVRACRGRT